MPLVVTHYGADTAVSGHLEAWEEAMAADYPEIIASADRIRARVDWFCRWADVVVRNLNPGYLPRWDVLWPAQYAIEMTDFVPAAASGADGRNGPVNVVHAPNHRALKGTSHVEQAVADLRAEGLDVRLTLVEGRPNTEVRAALREADVLVDQLLIGYGLLAVEGMATGLPVLSRTSWMSPEVARHPAIRELPIIDADVATVRERLREIVTDPARRATLGEEGLRFARRWHSEEATGRTWAAIVCAMWSDAPVPRESEPLG
jgi:glycosyltransferase involved in cell wall biosynthesis